MVITIDYIYYYELLRKENSEKKHGMDDRSIGFSGEGFWAIIISILSLIVAVKIGYVANSISQSNQPIVIDPNSIMLVENKDSFCISIKDIVVAQGGVKKAYVTYEVDKEIRYAEMVDQLVLPKSSLDLKKINLETSKDGEIEYILQDHNASVYDIVSFGLAILDYSNNWNYYLLLVQPSIVFPGITHSASGVDAYGDTALQTVSASYIAEQSSYIIDTCLINEATLHEKLLEYTFNVKKKAKWDNNSKNILTQIDTPAGGSIEITDSWFTFDITYPEQDASHIMQVIDIIYKDFR